MMISSFPPLVSGLSSKLCQNRTAGPLTGSIPILGGSSADKLSGPPPARKVSSCTSWCSGSSKQYSSGARTKRNSSDDPWKESVSKQGCYLKTKYYSFILITRCLAIWTFQFLHLVLTPPYHLPLVTFAFFSEMAGFMFLLSGGPPPDLSGPPPSGEFPPSGENSFHFTIFTEEPRWVSSQSSRH